MRKTTLTLVLACLPFSAWAVDPVAAGRWSGEIHVPGRDIRAVVDLERGVDGTWQGSLIVPGFSIKGAPLANIAVDGDNVRFDTGAIFTVTPYGPATFTGKARANGTFAGEFREAGNSTGFAFRKTGAAQVELAPKSTAVSNSIVGNWSGDYEMGGYPRHVTLRLENHPGGVATAEFTIVGKATTKVPVDLLREEEGMLRIESRAYSITFEASTRQAGTIEGTFVLGPYEAPLVLHRDTGGQS